MEHEIKMVEKTKYIMIYYKIILILQLQNEKMEMKIKTTVLNYTNLYRI